MQAPVLGSFLYFAYGSNLLSRRLIERTPSAQKVANGILHDHELRWHKAATDGSRKCDVHFANGTGARVHGVRYRIKYSEKPILDAAETLGIGYEEKSAAIETTEGMIESWLYYAIKIDDQAIPYDWYHALVINGAREHEFPQSYLQTLEAVRTKPDQDEARAMRHFSLLNAA